MYIVMHMFNFKKIFQKIFFFVSECNRHGVSVICLCVFVFVCGASAMKVNAWTCAPATDRDLDC